MFIRKKKFEELENRIKTLNEVLETELQNKVELSRTITGLLETNDLLEKKNRLLEEEIKNIKSQEKVELLVDTAEKPLVVEEKPKKKIAKKPVTGEKKSTAPRKVVRKVTPKE